MAWARAMGRFIRVCREEWAGLTRAQLAIAVNHLCDGKARVTPAMVEAWERGQPPRTTEQLKALIEVLRRQGVWAEEAEKLVQAVFKACPEQRFPELLLGEDVVCRTNVDRVLEETYRDTSTYIPKTNPVWLVDVAKELESAVIGRSGRRPTFDQQQRQEVALAYARAALAEYRGRRDGWAARWAAKLLDANADYVEARLGAAGLGGRLSVLGQRALAAFHRAHGLRSERDADRLFALSEAAATRGEKGVAAYAHVKGVHCLAESSAGLEPQHLRTAETLAEVAAGDRYQETWAPHLDVVWACLARRETDRAERCLARFEEWWRQGPADVPHCQCSEARAQIALQRGEAGAPERWGGWANHSTSRWRR